MNVSRLVLAVTMVLGVLSGHAQDSPKGQVFSISLSPLNTVSERDQEVDLLLTLTNISDHSIILRTSMSGAAPEFFCDVLIARTDGSEVAETDYERQVKGHGAVLLDYNSKLNSLKPGEKVQEHVRLSKLFKLTPGSYLIQIARPAEDLNQRSDKIKSNVVSLDVKS